MRFMAGSCPSLFYAARVDAFTHLPECNKYPIQLPSDVTQMPQPLTFGTLPAGWDALAGPTDQSAGGAAGGLWALAIGSRTN